MLSLNVPKNSLTVTKTLICNKKKNPQKQSLHCDYNFLLFHEEKRENVSKTNENYMIKIFVWLSVRLYVCLCFSLSLSYNEYLERRYSPTVHIHVK